jgi:transcriptional regulator with XRE-family HTH domain
MSQPDPDLVVLGRTIRELREEHGMSNADLAGAAQLTPERLGAT